MKSNTGTAYDLPKPNYDSTLTEVGKGTPGGEMLRRYWHPIGLASDATDRPKKVRVLGEDLVLFRDGQGRVGLVHARCCHRGTTLDYGRVEESGIRCCYHGWLFDVEGNCLNQMAEPGGGTKLENYRQPWYPVQEQYGLIFAYMGPAERKPVLPRYNLLESLDEGEFIEANANSIGSGGAVITPCNWFQHWENVVDPFHAPILHGTFSGVQFVPQMGIIPEVKFQYSPRGVQAISRRKLEDGKIHMRITEVAMPTLRVVANPRIAQYARCESIGWVLPIDDTHFRIYTAGRVRTSGEIDTYNTTFNGKRWRDMTDEEHHLYPGDYEAMVSQGPITYHSEEKLASSDQGIVMLRRFVARQIKSVQEGNDPVGVTFDEVGALVELESGNFLLESPDTPIAA